MTAFFQEIFQPRADCCFGQAEGFNNFDILMLPRFGLIAIPPPEI